MAMMNSTIPYRSWFSFTNIVTIIINICEIVSGFIFVFIILNNRTYRSIANFLAVNTVVSIIFLALTVMIIVANMSECDNHPDQCTGNQRCFFRDYINDVATTSAIYSLVVQSIDRFVAVVYANKVRLQTYHLRLILCILQWILAFLFPIYFVYIHPQLKYDVVSYVCVVSGNTSTFLIMYLTIIDAIIPFTIIVGVYIRLFVYVRRSRRTTNMILSSKRELRMAKRMFFLLAILALGSVPGTIFQSITSPPDYQYRIYYLSVTITSFFALLLMYIFTPQVKLWIIQYKNKMNGRVYPPANTTIRY